MSALQIAFIAFTFLAPPLLWLLSRRIRSPRLVNGIALTFAIMLAGAYALALALKLYVDATFHFDETLPMQLCDWAAVVTLLALIRRSPLAFELAYCWGLAGTIQALFTPAIVVEMNSRVIVFFIVHSIIPASVFWLIFEWKMRPRPGAYFRVMLWSEIYLGAALLTNALTRGNYGFLSERPVTGSLLDYFADPEKNWAIYVIQINATAAVAFGILLLPWAIWGNRSTTKVDTAGKRGTADA